MDRDDSHFTGPRPTKGRCCGQEVTTMKLSRFAFLLLAALLVAMTAGLVLADEDTPAKGDEAKAKFSEMTGKELYRNSCKVCHMPDSDNGEYTPMSLIMDQWEEFFDGEFTEAHKEVVHPQDKTKKVTDMFDKDMLKKIKKFCVDHAADSEEPMTCG